MTTVTEIYNSIDLSELRREPLFSSLTDNQLRFIDLKSKLEARIEMACKSISLSNGNIKNLESYNSFVIVNDEVINTFRQLYSNTKSSFIKKVLVTVGKSKKMSEKQLEMIAEEITKFNLTINF